MRSIALIGYMGAGKSTIGRLLAERLGFSFVETDALVEEVAGKSIARIFSEDGEATFRDLERSVIQAVTLKRGCIISCGGGATVDPRNLRLLRMSCRIVFLTAAPQVLYGRIAGCTSRPLASGIGGPEDIARRLQERRSAYATYDFCVDTGCCTESEAVDSIAEWMDRQRHESEILRLPVLGYSVAVGLGLMSRVGAEIQATGLSGKALLFSNDTVHNLYGEQVCRSLQETHFECSAFLMADGEAHKSLDTAEQAYFSCNQFGLERRSTIVALGGGVVGDVAGFVAGTYMRGVNLVQIPTTLLAMVDSSVGGKTAVNMPFGKNMVGVFYQPKLVIVDPLALVTLSQRDYRAGMVELLKHGFISNPALLDFIMARRGMTISFDQADDMVYAIAHSCAVKAEVVETDERDLGAREALNVGHTVGHALELVAGYGRLRHGEAVALGMLAETRAANAIGVASDECLDRVRECLEPMVSDLGVVDIEPSAVCRALAGDKKRRDGRVLFSVLERVGVVRRGVAIPDSVLIASIADSLRRSQR
jgi:shikimate kinase/3-dehydroquinate synthase